MIKLGSFLAIGDDGKSYTIQIFEERIDVSSNDGPASIGGLKRLYTSNGEEVNRIEKGEYEILKTGVMLLSSDSNAP